MSSGGGGGGGGGGGSTFGVTLTVGARPKGFFFTMEEYSENSGDGADPWSVRLEGAEVRDGGDILAL